jgi:excisionase family DNA binding protein
MSVGAGQSTTSQPPVIVDERLGALDAVLTSHCNFGDSHDLHAGRTYSVRCVPVSCQSLQSNGHAGRPWVSFDGSFTHYTTRWIMDRLLTADELAERLGMKTEWVWAQARAGRIPHVRLGKYRRFRESAVEAWLRDLETGGSGRAANPQARPIPLRRRS